MFCTESDLRSESDVEQKLIMPLLLAEFPRGCGFGNAEVYTKERLQFFEIDKGAAKKVYRPDYVILLDGIPVLAIEAKRPEEDIDEGLREARLYAMELNALYPTGINPCARVVACNGTAIVTAPADHHAPDCAVAFDEINPSTQTYHTFLEHCSKQSLLAVADGAARRLRKERYGRPLDLLGGLTARDEEIGYNQFGKDLAFQFEHLFNPKTPKQRANIVQNAYVASQRRRHYADEIEKVVHRAVPPSGKQGELIEDTSVPKDLLRLLGRGTELQNKLMLLVGAVGSGKSTFIDYFRVVKLAPALGDKTVWVHVDINDSPQEKAVFEEWITKAVGEGLRKSEPLTDFDDPAMVKMVYAPELRKLEKRVLSSLPADSPKRAELIAAEIQKLDSDPKAYTKALARHLCGDRHKLLVVVMDNCDKGDAAEQLTVFQIVRWLQSWLTCMVFLPLRDVTYDVHKNKPPLDTVIKDYVFRIEPPPFTQVLRMRIALALDELKLGGKEEMHSYTLDNGATIYYPASDLGVYLACLYKSIFEHDELLRRMLIGLADRNLRRAIEIFIEFCKSGHIGASQIFKIRLLKGDYALPYDIVTRVLLRLNRRFYDGNHAIVRNLFQCDPNSPTPSHFSRYSILKWLEGVWKDNGPTGVKGFHRVDRLLKDLSPLGIDNRVLFADLRYLVEAGCVATEHQRPEIQSEADLISLSASGRAHLRLVSDTDYLAACAEDTWMANDAAVRDVAERIGRGGPKRHFSSYTQAKNADTFARYLASDRFISAITARIVHPPFVDPVKEAERYSEKAQRHLERTIERLGWKDAEARFQVGQTYPGWVDGKTETAVFVKLEDGPTAIMHADRLPDGTTPRQFARDQRVFVRVVSVNEDSQRMSVSLAGGGEAS